MNETSVKQMNKVIFKIFLPLLVFCNIYNTELAESFNSHLLLYGVAGVLIQFVLSLCLAILLEKDNSRRGVMLQGCSAAILCCSASPSARPCLEIPPPVWRPF